MAICVEDMRVKGRLDADGLAVFAGVGATPECLTHALNDLRAGKMMVRSLQEYQNG